jgi:alpha-2-macroglobulin
LGFLHSNQPTFFLHSIQSCCVLPSCRRHFLNIHQQAYVGSNFAWQESGALYHKTLATAAEYQASNGGMTYYIPKDESADPFLSAFTALAFNWLRSYGHTPPPFVEDKLHDYLQSLLRRDAMAETYSKGMAATVRAVALTALGERGKISLDVIERFATHAPAMSLFGKALYLQALTYFPQTSRLQREVVQTILAHADQTSGTLTFSESLDVQYKTLLSSPLRSNCAILSALLKYQAAHPEQTELGDLPLQLARTISQSRKGRDCWPSTQENIFALQALEASNTEVVCMGGNRSGSAASTAALRNAFAN